ncbi:MAG TPA: TonB family protein [Candidatus Acidoferrales bacterium]|nr:TonB family protein [Candidatus Acidoferrales bacterium]
MSGLKVLPLGLVVFLYVGCATFGQMGSEITPPTLIQKIPLPSPPPALKSSDFNLKMDLLISKEGKVLYAQLQNSTGDPQWDSAAVKCILQWRYSPAMANGKPIQLKISQLAHVIPSPPLMMKLSEIMCTTMADADSAYAALQTGDSFESLAKKYSASPSAQNGGDLGPVDIHMYEDEVQDVLQKLKPGEYTHPIPFGLNFVIFKRSLEGNQL